MNTALADPDLRSTGPAQVPAESNFVELALLLPEWQVQGLEEIARSKGMNTAQLLRRLIARFVCETSI